MSESSKFNGKLINCIKLQLILTLLILQGGSLEHLVSMMHIVEPFILILFIAFDDK